MRELVADGIGVTVSCRVLGLARAPFSRWLHSPFSDAQLDETWLANAIFDVHRGDPEFGYRFLADEIRHNAEHADVSDRVVWRICCDHRCWSVFGKKQSSRTSKPGTPSHDALVERDFTATKWSDLMGQVGSAGDNAAMESFFALLQNNVLPRRPTHRHHQLDRTHLPPTPSPPRPMNTIEFETIMTPQAAPAA